MWDGLQPQITVEIKLVYTYLVHHPKLIVGILYARIIVIFGFPKVEEVHQLSLKNIKTLCYRVLTRVSYSQLTDKEYFFHCGFSAKIVKLIKEWSISIRYCA
nr:MAG TPA: hypothetical protein [Caudoviricetes sp.]